MKVSNTTLRTQPHFNQQYQTSQSSESSGCCGARFVNDWNDSRERMWGRRRLSLKIIKTNIISSWTACTTLPPDHACYRMRCSRRQSRILSITSCRACFIFPLLIHPRSGMSVMEMSHRSKLYGQIHQKCIEDLRELLQVPSTYDVLLMPGGGTGQFAAVPLNLTSSRSDKAGYITTGTWSAKAVTEASKFVDVVDLWSNKKATSAPTRVHADDVKYVYYCGNETISGLEFSQAPEIIGQDTHLVADMSSNFCTRPVDVKKHGVIFGEPRVDYFISWSSEEYRTSWACGRRGAPRSCRCGETQLLSRCARLQEFRGHRKPLQHTALLERLRHRSHSRILEKNRRTVGLG